jgi:tripartite-type tricarboxylate transporter receptor subunit TctC
MMITRRHLLAGAAGGLAAAAAPGVRAQQSGARALRIVLGFAAGGGTDALGRALAEALKPGYPGGVTVENRVGASGRLALQAVKAAEPDGQTVLFTPDFALTVYPHTFTRLGYDPVADFAPVAVAARSGYALCAGPAVPAGIKDVRDYIAWVKANPAQGSYGSSGAGTTLHLAGAMLEQAAGVKLNHVPYKGGALSMQDVMGGQIPVSINAVGEALPMLQSGRLRVLGTFGPKRNPFMPTVPNMVESGFKDVVSEAWLAFLLPARTPADVVSRLGAAINQATESQELKDRFARFGMEAVTGNAQQLAALIESDTRRWAPIVRAVGFKAEE